ncbi:hypothetical protein [Novosphingobium ginsenosidimutans]|uniref:Flagellar hook-length control protein FliK n=1 Tax=Novosphingobium ginsenosidimutans TaxID=1176536 RepID=A0A5B8S469_9SPHN|nr:hypothetical protein [Novosphingobium ginsenosidimutans]QEA16329.1 hypothetical protein FRF71_09380 [Novosphingobium ginsenosidimutans]
MLPTAALPTLMTGATPIETPLPNGAQTAENGDFNAILAETAAVRPVPLESLLEVALDPAAAVPADGKLPESGKDLPDTAEPASETETAIPILALLPLPIAAAGPAAPLQPALDRPLPPAQSPVLNPLNVDPDQPLPRLAPGKTAKGPAQSAAPTLPQAPQVAAAELPPVTLLRDGPRQAPPPRVAATLRLLAEAEPDKGTIAAPELPLTAAATATPAQQLPFVSIPAAASANAPATAPTAMAAGHDFAQMIDRLVAARENTQPHAATLALAHADFGQVELRFNSDTNGLSVSLASADPDFARAVQAAVPPVQSSSDSAAAQGRQQGQSGSQPESSAGQQQHGQQAAGREPNDRFVAANPRPRSTESGERDGGIFA